jgi:hypothetical protein
VPQIFCEQNLQNGKMEKIDVSYVNSAMFFNVKQRLNDDDYSALFFQVSFFSKASSRQCESKDH